MAKKFIEAERLEHHFEYCIDEVKNTNGVPDDFEIALAATKNQPAADVQEVRHGKWIDKKTTVAYEYHGRAFDLRSVICSECGEEMIYEFKKECQPRPHYCSNCGCRMDSESNG